MVRIDMKRLKSVFFIVLLVFLICPGVLSYGEVVDKVIVVVNDEVLTQREYDRAFMPLKKEYAANLKGEELETQLAKVAEELKEQMINAKLTISLAKKEKIEVKEEEITQRIDTIRAYFDSEEKFLHSLKTKGTNLTEFKKEISEQMLAQKLVEKEVASKIVVSPSEIRDLYDKNKDKLISPEKVKVRSIMMRKIEAADEENAAKREKLTGLREEIKSGKSFAEVAKSQSEGPYAEVGGDMGYIVQGQLIPEIDKVVFSLTPGEVSDILETALGYHIFLVEEKNEAKPLELVDVSDYLRERIYMRKFQEDIIKWLTEKRKNAYIAYK